jgi:hypothetical protein
MIVAYADPPYIGQARKHYSTQAGYAGEVDHTALLERLAGYRHWVLSCSSTSLQRILCLPACPPDVRIGAWVKPFCAFKPNVNPAYAWEPVIFRGSRKRGRHEETVRDWTTASITLQRGLAGAKPEAFCFWLFALMGMQRGDDLVDLFPGSGAVTAAWEKWQRQLWPLIDAEDSAAG